MAIRPNLARLAGATNAWKIWLPTAILFMLSYFANSTIAHTKMLDKVTMDTISTEPMIQATTSTLLGLTGEGWDRWLIGSVILAAVGGIAVGLTTAGSVITHKREAVRAERELETYKTSATAQIASAGADASRANEAAAKANERAAVLEKDAADVRGHTAQLSLDLERERLERVKLQASISSRHVTPEQRTAMRDLLSHTNSIIPMVNIVRIGDEEANIYATEIFNALNGKVSIHISDVGLMVPPLTGIMLQGRNKAIIRDAFDAASIPVVEGPDIGAEGVQITVGLKPVVR